MSRSLAAFLAVVLLLSASSVAADDPFTWEFTELAPGVWAGQRPDPTRLPVMGNTLFVVTDEGVVVFDGGGVPLMTERLLRKIDEVTDQPVTHVGISHWHGDHHFGIWKIQQRYPDVEIVAHPFTDEAQCADRPSGTWIAIARSRHGTERVCGTSPRRAPPWTART